MRRPKFNGVVLAGGLSSRMGSDKAQLSLDGQSLLERAKAVLAQAGAERVFVSSNTLNGDALPDIYPQRGPLCGLHAALLADELPIVAMPVDMPLLSAFDIQLLFNHGAQMESIVTFVDHNLPIYVPNLISIRRYLERTLSGEGNTSIKRFLLANGSSQVNAEAQSRLVNVNTPQDWQALRQELETNTELQEPAHGA